MRDLIDFVNYFLFSSLKPISRPHPIAKLFGSEMSERVTVCHVYLGLCPVSRQIWISSQTSHICYSLLQYVTRCHVTCITSHFTLFVRRITIVYLLI